MTEELKQNQSEAPAEKQTRGEKVWEIIRVFVLPIAVVLFVRLYIVQPFIVKGESMEPNFEDKEYLVIDEISPRLEPIARGTVVVFRYPVNPSEFFIKRVIGLPGEHITIKDGAVTITTVDGKKLALDESYLARGTVTIGDVDVNIPENEYFVMGDNRNFSSDSRRWGLLNKDFLTGRALLRLWPPEKIGVITHANY